MRYFVTFKNGIVRDDWVLKENESHPPYININDIYEITKDQCRLREYLILNNDIAEWKQPEYDNYLQNEINNKSLKYLANTDWYVIRFQETGKEIPSDVLEARAKARETIK